MRIWWKPKPRRRVKRPCKHYATHKERARAFVHERVMYFAATHGFLYKRIAIRNTKRCWGSCSELGNLNFNYKILFLPEHLADYIIVHELCHLREFNHSENFWGHVAAIIPDYKKRRKSLREVEHLPPGKMKSASFQ